MTEEYNTPRFSNDGCTYYFNKNGQLSSRVDFNNLDGKDSIVAETVYKYDLRNNWVLARNESSFFYDGQLIVDSLIYDKKNRLIGYHSYETTHLQNIKTKKFIHRMYLQDSSLNNVSLVDSATENFPKHYQFDSHNRNYKYKSALQCDSLSYEPLTSNRYVLKQWTKDLTKELLSFKKIESILYEKGLPIVKKRWARFGDQELVSHKIFSYNSQGQLLKIIEKDNNSNKTECFYNENKLLNEINIFKSNETKKVTFKYTYY